MLSEPSYLLALSPLLRRLLRFLDKYPKRDFMKVSAIEVQLSSGAIAITSFHFSRAWGVLGKSIAPTSCRSEIGLSQSEWILGRFWELCWKATPGCGLWVATLIGGCAGWEQSPWIVSAVHLGLAVDRNGQSIEFVSGWCNRLPT